MIKTLAAIFACLTLVKIVFLVFAPQKIFQLSQYWLKQSWSSLLVGVLTVSIGIIVFTTVDIITIAAVMLFMGLLVKWHMMAYTEPALQMAKAMLQPAELKRQWLFLLFWVVFVVMVLYRVF